MQSTVVRYDESKPIVEVGKKHDMTRDLNIPSKAKLRSSVKKKALHVYSWYDEDGELNDVVFKHVNPADVATTFGTVFGRNAKDAVNKMTAEGDEISEEEIQKAVMADAVESEESLEESLARMDEQITAVILKAIVMPEDIEQEDVEDMDRDLRLDMFRAFTREVTGSGDSVDSFSGLDNE